MAHPVGEAVEQPAGNPLDEILKFAGEEPDTPEEEEDADDPEADDLEPEGEEELGEDEGEEDEGDEPTEVITPPVSLNKEQKAAFAQLPPELQKVWSESEAQRNEQVRIKTTEAAEATRNANATAQAQLGDALKQYANEVEILAEALKPAEPDYALLATDPMAFGQQEAVRKQLQAQYDYLMQRVVESRQTSSQIDQQAMQRYLETENAKLAAALPDWADTAKRPVIIQELGNVAEVLGYDPARIREADAADILAISKAAEWKSKAEKWDSFQTRKMANVRAAKALPKVAKPGTAPSRNVSNAQRADAAWQRAQQTKSGADYADFLEASGIKL